MNHLSKIISSSETGTKEFAKTVLDFLPKTKNRASVIALHGDLGSGKTTLVQGLADALGIQGPTTSPTFLIIKKHNIPRGDFKYLYHIDAYRLQNPKELETLGFKDLIGDSENLVVVEWAERVESLIPSDAVWLVLEHRDKEEERLIKIL